ncbi:Uncharacterised protein [Sarcina ventriculi]|uniref:hypothetical protein n=1 Tax=Sarcina ventriculi TaxID=1267 RepID=UPI000D8DA0AE|nr:hypothetical protein [Sarcina ventriculi]SPZ49721.1 Uncharacterised protein [Sarcina ventriculi]
MKEEELIKNLEKELFDRDTLKSNGISEKDIKILLDIEKMIKVNHKYLYLFMEMFSNKISNNQIKKVLLNSNDIESKLEHVKILVNTTYNLLSI